jgi:UDP-GlcNAc:undecaprenyl-phosphate GlcNAc-1-phosphate transferase
MLFVRDRQLAWGLLWASLVLLVVGVIDDRWGMRGKHKLLGQIVAALLLTSYGLEIRQLQLLGWTIDLGVLAVPFTVFWLLGAINALNLLDGFDGLAATVGLLTSLLIACISIISGQPFAALVSLALAGGCLAFLHVNLPPARMFLGDTGSMLVGLMLGGLSAVSCSNGPGLLSLAPAVGLLALPIFDSTFALLRRRLTGRSIYMTDRGHLHHCLMQALENHHSVLLVTWLACLASGVGAVLSVYMKNDVTAIVSTALTVILLVAMRLFGHVECKLFLHKLTVRLARPFRLTERRANGSRADTVSVRLQGERNWNLLWQSLTEWAEKLQLLRVDLDVNLPAVKESFHANWYQPTARERHECWSMELPLFVNGRAAGRLQVCGERLDGRESICDAVDQIIDLLGPFEQAFVRLAESPHVLIGPHEVGLATEVARPHRARNTEEKLVGELVSTASAKAVTLGS